MFFLLDQEPSPATATQISAPDQAAPSDSDLEEPEPISLTAIADSRAFTPALWKGIIPFCLLAALIALALTVEDAPPGTQPPFPTSTSSNSSQTEGNVPLSSVLQNASETTTPDNTHQGGQQDMQQAPNAQSPAKPISPDLSSSPATQSLAPAPVATAPPGSPGKAAFEQGEAALRQRKLADAKAAFQQALQLDGKLAPAHLRLAAIAANANDAKETQFHLESAARLMPNDAEPRLQLSELFLNLRQPQKAEQAALSAVQVSNGPQRRAAQAVYARLLMANRKEAQAYQQWTALLQSNPGDAEAAFSASLIAERLRKPQDAQKWMSQAIKNAPSNPEVSIGVARYLVGKKRIKEADTLLSTSARRFPTYIPLRLTWAELKMARGDDKSAIADLRGLQSKVPANVAGGGAKAEVSVALAQALTHSGQTKQAAVEAKNALKLQPRNPVLVSTVAEILLGSGDTKGGIATLKTLLQLDPKNAKAHYVLAGAYADSKQWDAAQSELDAYIKAEPDDLNAIASKAHLQEQRGNKNEALQTWNSLAQKKPDEPFVALQQARLLVAMQRPAEALPRYQAVLKKMPQEPNALMGAAEIEEKRGDIAAALNHMKQFVAVEPGVDEAYAALARLAKKQNQMAPTVEYLKTQLSRNPDRRGAYALILDYYEAQGKAETGRDFVKSYIDKNPKLPAPRAAIDAFDLRRAQSELAGLERADKAKTSAANADNNSRDKGNDAAPFRPHGSTLPVPNP